MPRASGRSCYWTHAMCVSIQERTYAPPTIVAPHRTRSRVLRPGAGAGGRGSGGLASRRCPAVEGRGSLDAVGDEKLITVHLSHT